MIQSIKLKVDDGEKEQELCFDYEDNVISIYIQNNFICSLDYDGNFKEGIKKMVEQW